MVEKPYRRSVPALANVLAAALGFSAAVSGQTAKAGAEAIAPVAVTGSGFSVNEGDLVSLDGIGSHGGGGGGLTYFWSQLPGGTPVSLAGSDTPNPFFTAPAVAAGGETLDFLLTVGSGGEVSTDTVSITVVNRNHPPVADVGQGRSVAQGTTVTLDGGDSFDVDSDLFAFQWKQVSGPDVSLSGADGPNPSFKAPFADSGGAVGVVATLVFELRVDDGHAFDTPAPGYEFADVTDTVTILVTNSNNLPSADAGCDQTVVENSAVTLTGAGSWDPDSDRLTYAWIQEPGGVPVVLSGADTMSPSFTAPDVEDHADLAFTLTVDDGYGGRSTDTVTVNVLRQNAPPLADAARPTIVRLWPPDHRLVGIGIQGVSDPGNPTEITIDSVFQDEPTDSKGDGDAPIDAFIQPDGTVLLRAERAGNGEGRTYSIHFTATGEGGSSSGVVEVFVPHGNGKMDRNKRGGQPADGGDVEPFYDSTL